MVFFPWGKDTSSHVTFFWRARISSFMVYFHFGSSNASVTLNDFLSRWLMWYWSWSGQNLIKRFNFLLLILTAWRQMIIFLGQSVAVFWRPGVLKQVLWRPVVLKQILYVRRTKRQPVAFHRATGRFEAELPHGKKKLRILGMFDSRFSSCDAEKYKSCSQNTISIEV